MDLIIASTIAGSFDRYVSKLIGYPWGKVLRFRRAVTAIDLPFRLENISLKFSPALVRTRTFRLKQTFRNYIALTGYKSRFITRLGYESWFGWVVLHAIRNAFAGNRLNLGRIKRD